MTTICIIDDQKLYLDIVENEIKKKYINYEIIKLQEYNYKLLKDKNIDLFILDIDLQGFNGIDLALLLKEHYPFADFVFLSAHNNLIHDSLMVRPLYFLRKDCLYNDFKILFKLLDFNKYQQTLVLTDNNKIERAIPINNIIYVEIRLHYLTIFLENDKYIFHLTLKELKQKVKDSNLIQIHKSYMVNINKIDNIKGNECFMYENIILPIGRKYKSKFIEAYRKNL